MYAKQQVEEAFEFAAEKLSAAKEKYGSQGILWSSSESFQELFFKNLALAFGSPNIVRHSTSCLTSVNLAFSLTFGTTKSSSNGTDSSYCSIPLD
jgi:anaerobic selenocysteine-containing dehydrogenase